ncbi:hypothetical protein VP01_7003g1 [Puccinia sorghi]|uniref:Uncharacterized protein n=1 Tax=Puccinia sorghi TaxID=27349 RepID=A0A0L6UDX6_9BASI|nr:hypothetical protein VP01_7003g1 [Puccinia sorghi]
MWQTRKSLLVRNTRSHHPRFSSSSASISHLGLHRLPQLHQTLNPRSAFPHDHPFTNNSTPDWVHFQNLVHGVIKSFQGSVLSQGWLLKNSDYFASGIDRLHSRRFLLGDFIWPTEVDYFIHSLSPLPDS